MAKPQKQAFNFEQALNQLTALIEQMEQGQLTLEQSLLHFEQGVTLVRQCQQALTDAEQKVKILTEQQGELQLTPYETQPGENET